MRIHVSRDSSGVRGKAIRPCFGEHRPDHRFSVLGRQSPYTEMALIHMPPFVAAGTGRE